MDWVNLILLAILLGAMSYLVRLLNKLLTEVKLMRTEVKLMVRSNRTTQHSIQSQLATQKGPQIDARGVVTTNPNKQDHRGAKVGRIGRVVRVSSRKTDDA